MSKKNLTAYLQNRPVQRYFWPDFFPAKTTPFLTFETIIGSKGNPVMADITAFNVSAPRKRRKTVGKLTGDISPIRIKRAMEETDLNSYNVMKALATPDEQAILDLVFNDVDFVYDGCMARMEWLALQILAYPKLTLAKTTNAGVVTESAIDFQMQTANKKGCAVVWSASVSTTTPITDFITVNTAAKTAGVKLKYALMDETAFGYFAVSDEVKNYCYGALYGATKVKLTPTLDEVNQMLRQRMLPEIVVINQYLTFENEDHTQSTVTGWKTGYVTFIPDLAVGNMMFGPIAEETNPPKQTVQVKNNNILISKFSEVDPVVEWTKGETNAFPSWTRIDECFSLKVDNTTWS